MILKRQYTFSVIRSTLTRGKDSILFGLDYIERGTIRRITQHKERVSTFFFMRCVLFSSCRHILPETYIYDIKVLYYRCYTYAIEILLELM